MTRNPVSAASFTHFGYPKDLKSEPTYHSIEALAHADVLEDVFVLDVEQTYGLNPDLFEVPVPGGKTIPRAFYLAESVVPRLDAREATIRLFDDLASRRVGSPETLHSFPHLVKTLRAAREAGSTTAVYASSSHPKHVRSLLVEERERYGLDADADLDERVQEGFELADYVLYLSEYSGETFREYGVPEDRLLKVGPLAADLDAHPATTPPEDEFTVVSVANMNELKGVQYLLDAWQQLDLPDARLLLCGTVNDAVRKIVGSEIDDLEGVEHVGYVDDPADYYERASVLVHPSLTEGFSKTIAEAMASSVPVVITEHAQREYVGGGGFVVPIRDPEAIANRLRYLYDNPREAREMGERAREIATSNTWSDFSERVKRVHEEILQREA
ncbi:glycosyltransferase family 4 protein [Salinarchaeum laminariae]|uniref:glycosyltransferase family 4 protein n=1 Tax=Salinarchaeum laminariae TaxID=869888 RepID=UPI0020C1523F|nr:glycosyltransferase family 4 protein [Salinarchaeum laminariae]